MSNSWITHADYKYQSATSIEDSLQALKVFLIVTIAVFLLPGSRLSGHLNVIMV